MAARKKRKSAGGTTARKGCGHGKHGVRLCISKTPVPGMKCGKRKVVTCHRVHYSKGPLAGKIVKVCEERTVAGYACARKGAPR